MRAVPEASSSGHMANEGNWCHIPLLNSCGGSRGYRSERNLWIRTVALVLVRIRGSLQRHRYTVADVHRYCCLHLRIDSSSLVPPGNSTDSTWFLQAAVERDALRRLQQETAAPAACNCSWNILNYYLISVVAIFSLLRLKIVITALISSDVVGLSLVNTW
jgi:hypothetical protein